MSLHKCECSRIMRVIATCCLLLFVELSCASAQTSDANRSDSLFAQGKKYYDSGDIDKARQTWAGLSSDRLYGPITCLLTARSKIKTRDYAESEILIKDFEKSYPGSVYKDCAESILLEALLQQGKPEAAQLLFELIGKAHEREKPRLMMRLADLYKQLGAFQDAAKVYRALYLNYPASVQGLKSGEQLSWLVVHSKIPKQEYSESEQLARADRLFSRGRFDLAGEIYEAILKSKPGNHGLEIKLARCNFKHRQNAKALTVLQGVLNSKPSDIDRTEAQYLESLVYWRLGKDREFQQSCQKLVEKGSPRFKRKALFNLASFDLEKKDTVKRRNISRNYWRWIQTFRLNRTQNGSLRG